MKFAFQNFRVGKQTKHPTTLVCLVPKLAEDPLAAGVSDFDESHRGEIVIV